MAIPKITALMVGTKRNPVLASLFKQKDIHKSIVCSNLLDYALPPIIENAAEQWHRDELRHVLKLISPEIYQISPSLRNLLEDNNRLDLDELDLAITSHIDQIEKNSKSLDIAYDLLLEETKQENVSLFPLTNDLPNLLVFKSKKYAPLRFYHQKGELLKSDPPENKNKSKRKYDDKKLVIENLDILTGLKIFEKAYKYLQESDLILILPTDIISFGILVRATEIEKQIKKLNSPIVLVWPFNADREPSKIEKEIATTMEFGSSLDSLAQEIANLTDYIIIDKTDQNFTENLREVGCHVLVSDLWKENDPEIQDDFLETVFNIANIEIQVELDKSVEVVEDKSQKDDGEISNADVEEIDESKEDNGLTKSISQLVESPEEAGIKTDEKESVIENNDEDEKQVEGDVEVPVKNPKSPEKHVDNEKIETEIKSTSFNKEPEEEWIDTVNRGIDLSFDDETSEALGWLMDQSKIDNDNEVQIAQGVINAWINSRSNTVRKKGAEIVAQISVDRRDTYLQILQKEMITAVTEGQEDLRRKLIPIFSILNDVDSQLSEALTRGLTRELILLKDNEKAVVAEKSKLTILQLVILSRKLTRVCVNELLVILERNISTATNTNIWNILTAFDAGTVALELVTHFSLTKVNEILSRGNILRFTGSVIETINAVIDAWKNGDKASISASTGTILPEVTLRKFERLELARKVEKLKMVQLSALAESVGKDVETVERLITELIMNDELRAEMKLIEDKMYLVADNNDDSDT